MKFLLYGVAAVVLSLNPSLSRAADDPVKVAPDYYKVVLENDQVRVLEFTDQPGDKIGMHTHATDYLVYFVAPMKRRFTLPDGKTVEVEAAAREARWLAPVTHTEESIGTQGAHSVIVEMK